MAAQLHPSRGTVEGANLPAAKDSKPSMQPDAIHVLLVDDERLSRVVVGNLLRKCNYRVTVAESGLQALDALRHNPPGTFQLVLTDVMMPDVDGIELLRHVRQDDNFNSMPVVMMSANEHTDTVFECIRGGAEDYLLKPITKKEVQYIWQHVWRRQQQAVVRVPHIGPDEADDELRRSGSLPTDVPRAPLDLVQSSAAALQPAQQPERVEREAETGAAASSSQPGGQLHSRGAAAATPLVSPFQTAAAAEEPATAAVGSSTAGAAHAPSRADPPSTSQAQQAQGPQRPPLSSAAAWARAEMQQMLRQRQLSGQLASTAAPSSAQPESGGSGHHAQHARHAQQQRGGAGVAAGQSVSMAAYFAQRKELVNSESSFRLFCGVLAMLRPHHARGVPLGKVRPSCLRLMGNGAISVDPEARCAHEHALYASPEELLNAPASVKSDIYSLGVLFFELFHPLTDEAERARVLGDLRHRILPMSVLQGHPQEAAFVVSLLHPDPRARPGVVEILRSQTLGLLYRSICSKASAKAAGGQHAASADSARRPGQPSTAQRAGSAGEAAVDREVLLEFLVMMRCAKLAESEHMRQELAALNVDIGVTAGRLTSLAAAKDSCAAPGSALEAAMRANGGNSGSGEQGPRKRRRTMHGSEASPQQLHARSHSAPGVSAYNSAPSSAPASALQLPPGTQAAAVAADLTSQPLGLTSPANHTSQSLTAAGSAQPLLPDPSGASDPGQEQRQDQRVLSNRPSMAARSAERWQRVQRAFPQLDETFFKRRDAMQPPVGESGSREIPTAANNGAVDHLLSFSTDLSKFARYNSLQVRATLKYGDLLNAADMVCCTAFDRDDEFFATAGVSRRIKIFEFASVLDSGVDIHYPVLEIPSRSKLSSVCWNSYVKSNLICADYEGMIQLWDVNANSESMRFEEHSKRVWSVDFSQTDPTRFLSGSDDGTVRLWSMSDDAAVACIDSKANVCSVQFSPTNSNLMAFGSANYRVYLYDLRQISVPLAVIGGHSRAVSYVRWMGGDHLVSASTDNNLKLWDVATATSSSANVEPVTTFTGHINEKNFVGLSVTADGFLACGSENNAVYTYYKAIPLPLTHHQFSCTDPASGRELDASDCHQFVSTVCWNRKGSHLIAANSLGNIQVLELV